MSDRFIRVPEKDEEEKLSTITLKYFAWKNTETGTILLCEDDKDPNKATWLEHLFLLFTDQAEYYAVCHNCYLAYRNMQWSGSTNARGWRLSSQKYLQFRLKERAWCQFCDGEMGSGGWVS